MEFIQVDVFAEAPYRGNPLAVFPDAADLSTDQMQAIAREMNLSETTFVTATESDGYDVRIFTPAEELPFAGHPTIGTAWTLHHLGKLTATQVVQRSRAGATPIDLSEEVVWFERSGTVEGDLEDRDRESDRSIAAALGVEARDIGLEARELGRSGRLRPAFSDAGVRFLMVPLRDLPALARCLPRPDLLEPIAATGAYCFTASAAGRIRARGFFPGLGVAEDPATGSAAAALGLYLAQRAGAIDFEIRQGEEVGRPSLIHVRAAPDRVRVGGRCALVLRGRLELRP